MEIGLYTFGELAPLPGGGWSDERTRMRELVEEMVLADQVGLDVFGIGEHHRPDFVVSAPAVVLAAGAERTERIRLSSAVTVLSSDDPVRVYQQYATLDLLSGGRAEIMAGRGSFIESFPLFGYDLRDYDALFAEKLELLLTIREDVTLHWKGGHRPAVQGRGVHPRSVQDPLPIWIAIGGTPESAVRAGTLNLPLVLAIIGGMPERFAPFAELFRRAAAAAGHTPAPPFAVAAHGLVADTSQAAKEAAYPPLAAMMNRIARERGFTPMDRSSFEAATELRGATLVGSPEQVAEKILFQHSLFKQERYLLQMIGGGIPHAQVMRSIELLGTKVAPIVRAATADTAGTTGTTGTAAG